ncbi:putative poly(glycerol-phosphate) alpha-glucosyltransferase [Actinomadura rubteroloni]|uniref:Putative poly(Glycerol-phosphate) alpha-glucosyltransferase n=1 Tax=Actinomadura rubteroloni TaxID=1926885 RepID=A0A2P4UJU0_9ACTN|nr:glycosyltransferase family 4 protein [Actinomadura rubteroloni]POM25313.1 putative poly(glycerol-phosphate) alpha-glucosyltransferase [Actinomadura rubteroloni]
MKITYVLTWAYGMGGTIRTVISQANAMAREGHDVEIVSVLQGSDEPKFPVDPRVRMVTLLDRRGTGDPPDAPPGRYVPEAEPAASAFTAEVEDTVAAAFAQVRDRILVTTRPALNLLSARFTPKSTVRVAQEHLNLGIHRPPVREAILDAYGALDVVVTLTERDQNAYREAFGAALRVERIPNALHTLDVARADPDTKTVVAAGRLSRQKGFDFLIPAFEQVAEKHPDWRLRIYGGGPDKDKLKRAIQKRHLYNHVFLMGKTDAMDKGFAKGSVFALSSRFEGFGMVLIEALSHGLATVSFDCPEGPAEILTDEHDGLLVPPRDVDALAAGLNRVIEDDGLRRDLGEAGLKTARAYGPDSVLPQWERLFADLTGG